METYSPILDCQARAGALLAPISENCADIRVGLDRMCEMCQLVTDEILRCISLNALKAKLAFLTAMSDEETIY